MKLEDVIRSKGTEVVTVAPDATVGELVSLMTARNIGAVVVSGDGHHVDGIVSERDIVRTLAERGADLASATARDLMTSEVVTGSPADPIEDTAHTMTNERVRHIPILVDDRLAAIVSIGDVVKYRIDQLTDERNHLLGYLHT